MTHELDEAIALMDELLGQPKRDEGSADDWDVLLRVSRRSDSAESFERGRFRVAVEKIQRRGFQG